jgi:predicted GNAT superfamily acetyltransferase
VLDDRAVTRVEIPAEYGHIRAENPAAAEAERDRVREALQEAFAAGGIVAGFDRQASAYLLTREPPAR